MQVNSIYSHRCPSGFLTKRKTVSQTVTKEGVYSLPLTRSLDDLGVTSRDLVDERARKIDEREKSTSILELSCTEVGGFVDVQGLAAQALIGYFAR